MRISFYIPDRHLPGKELRASWESGLVPHLLPGGKAASAQAWLFQTWLAVRDALDTRIVGELPDDGLIVTLANFLPPGFRASANQCIAAVAADFLPHPGAQAQILQNAAHARRFPGSFFMPHWPQPNLIPRDPARGTRFETLAFFGDLQNLAPELKERDFEKQLRQRCGMELSIRGAERWHDYSDVDAVLAVRDFTQARHLHKPATKLYNAWLAGVPFLAGRDSAYSAEASPGIDYLVADSPKGLLELVENLQRDPEVRHRLVRSGETKTASRNRDAVRRLWLNFLKLELPRRMEAWRKLGRAGRSLFWLRLSALAFIDRKFRS